MTSKQTVRSKTSRAMALKLKPKLNIAHVRTLQAQLNKALGAGKAVVLDGCKVERADTASLQLLCAFFMSSHAQGVEVRWKKAPATALCRDAAMLGMAELLKLPDSGRN